MGNKLDTIPRLTRALMKSHLLSCGYAYEDIEKPIIGIANSWNEFNHGHIPQRQIADFVKDGVRAAGGLPLEFNTIGPCDALAQGYEGMDYILPSREIIADSLEVMVRSQFIIDGLVFISSCDKITPGMLMAVLRLDIPSIHVCSGTCIPAIPFSESKRLRKDFLEGRISERKMAEGNAMLYPHPGICPYIGTANTMNIFVEALGLSLPGSSTIPAATSERLRCAQKTGQLAVTLARSARRPSAILSESSFRNGLRVLAALAGSLNHLLHVPAIARQVGVHLDFDSIASINEDTPQLCTINPNGEHSIADLHRAGGVPAVLKELRPLLDLSALNVESRDLDHVTAEAVNLDTAVIRPLGNPVAPHGGIVILKGNIARQGAAVRTSTVPPGMLSFSGPARVFDSEEQATEAIEANRIPEGSVVVIRFEGPKGGPGMREMHRIAGAFLGRRIAVVTDGRFSGATGGLSVGYLSPEAAQDGEIACIENGDEIAIDVMKRTIEARVDERTIKERMRAFHPGGRPEGTRILKEFARRVGSTFEGALREEK
ncbi:MAG: dihydroxy-acid dehydratase [Spirochaetia bacterium]